MILLFGMRPGKTKINSLEGVVCPHCEQVGTMTVTKTFNWFHLFWIKIYKVSSNTMAECSHCKRVYFKDEFSKEMRQADSSQLSE